jgi:predicted DNA-binding transcriptional regulator YafY
MNPWLDPTVCSPWLICSPDRHRLDELTARLETTPRTIYRDLAALELRGFPIERVDGTYRLMTGPSSSSLPLTARERVLLALALDNPSFKRQPALARDLRQLRLNLAAEIDAEPVVARRGGPDQRPNRC